jgi:galactoside O-acetyltransferase
MEIDKIIILQSLGAAVLGPYAVSFRVVGVFLIPISALASSILPRLFSLEDNLKIYRLVKIATLISIGYGMFAGAVLWLIAPLVPRIFGVEFSDSIAYVVLFAEAGFKALGTNILIAKTCTIVGSKNIEIGNNVRIDGYCTISAANYGWLKLGSFIHIGGYCFLSAGAGITMADFSGLSQGVKIYSKSDDYSGNYLTNPTIPEKYSKTTNGVVSLEKHVIIGSGTVILPNVTIHEGTSVGALSLVSKSLEPWGVYFGCPAKRLKNRSKKLLELEAELRKEVNMK